LGCEGDQTDNRTSQLQDVLFRSLKKQFKDEILVPNHGVGYAAIVQHSGCRGVRVQQKREKVQ